MWAVPGVQLVDDGVVTAPYPGAVWLGADDVPDMLDLVERTRTRFLAGRVPG